jgi:hypothetical protein
VGLGWWFPIAEEKSDDDDSQIVAEEGVNGFYTKQEKRSKKKCGGKGGTIPWSSHNKLTSSPSITMINRVRHLGTGLGANILRIIAEGFADSIAGTWTISTKWNDEIIAITQ